MSGLNKVTLVGNLGRDPEMRYTADGVPVTAFSLAVSDGKKGDTVWFRISCWRGLAELTNTHLRKGRQVFVEGRLRPHEFEGQDGKPRFALDVVAEKVVFLGRKPEDDAPSAGGDGDDLLDDVAGDTGGDGDDLLDDVAAGISGFVCGACHGTRYWMRRDGQAVCSVCHPATGRGDDAPVLENLGV